MKKLVLALFSFLILSFAANAQDFLGYMNSNYSGILGTDLQPAAVVDSRFKTDFNLIGFSIGLSNNYVALKHDALKHNGSLFNFTQDNYPAFQDTSFARKYLTVNTSDKTKKVNLNNRIYMPSIMISLNSKNAFALKWKVRSIVNIDGIEGQLASLIYNQLNYPSLFLQELHNKDIRIETMTWAEYGLTYGHVFKEEGEHFFKAAATVKLIQGLQAAYLSIDDLDYKFSTDTTVSLFRTNVSYAHSTNYDNANQQSLQYKFVSHPSFGLDLGVVYEWRPDYQDYKYEMNGQKNLTHVELNKYKLRVGISVLDLGSVKFDKGKGSNDFNADIGYWNIHHVSPTSFSSFSDTLSNRFYKGDTAASGTFKMHLPTVLSAQIDYKIWKDFYVNLTPYYAFQFKNNKMGVHELSNISLTPRWDHRNFGLFVPVSYDAMGRTKVGVGLRIGPLIFGTSNLGPYITKKDIYGADFQVMFRVGVKYPQVRDKDHDKVSDDRDRCRDVPGVWEFYGCPDRDGDHVEDKDDLCPDEPGLPEFNGCPDKDGDKIPDKQDACPDDPGLPEFNGCPDRDGDKIIDKEDACPDDPGLPALHGCPDRDGDGVIDKLDLCPDKPGPASNQGCPEVKLVLVDSVGNDLRTVIQAKDGSFNFDDLPKDEKVRFKVLGEHADTIFDAKVVVGGIAKKAIKDVRDGYLHFIILKTDLNILKQEAAQDVLVKLDTVEQAIVQKAFSNLEFATGNNVIKKESYTSLNDLAALLTKHPKWRLKISGHTDSDGLPAANMKLSQNRAEAVKKYLTGKGVDAKRFKVEWFGATKPIADNKTAQGRQKNRRVEMVIIK